MNIVRRLRGEKRKTMREVAKETGLAFYTLQHIETYKPKTIQAKTLGILSAYFGMGSEYIFDTYVSEREKYLATQKSQEDMKEE
jgi:transcriptional regulator with XRE-family HTH domain